MNRAERRDIRNRKIKKRLRLMNNLGMQGGSLYEKHRNKIRHSGGFMSKGNVSHYVATWPRRYYNRNEGNKHGILCISEEDTVL